MKLRLRAAAVAGALLITVYGGGAAFALKQGGILRVYHWDSPASMSIHEEATYSSHAEVHRNTDQTHVILRIAAAR